ncbi:MAG: SprB repeat-containing protein [Bacteroidota bacterium]
MNIRFTCVFLLFVRFLPAQPCCPSQQMGVEIEATNSSCPGFSDGAIRIALITGIGPVTYQWSGNGLSGNGQITPIDAIDILFNIPPGLYTFTLTDPLGNISTMQVTVEAPKPFQGSIVPKTNYNGFAVSCANTADGVATAVITGGTAPYYYQWSNGDTKIDADSLSGGMWEVTVTDINGCPFKISGMISAPPALVSVLTAHGDKCYGQNIGAIEINSISGGVPPYMTIFGNEPPSNQTKWKNLTPGNYFLSIVDDNGCKKDEAAILPTGLLFTLDIGVDSSIFSGDTLLYSANTNRPIGSLVWTPNDHVLPASPSTSLLFPSYSTKYTLTATDTSGCVAVDDVLITVHRSRSVYAPNVFAPNAKAAENQSFTLFSGGGIDRVKMLRVYDRNGRLWFDKENFPIGLPAAGWFGNADGDDAPPGVYLWQAVVVYTDGREERMFGDVTVIR